MKQAIQQDSDEVASCRQVKKPLFMRFFGDFATLLQVCCKFVVSK